MMRQLATFVLLAVGIVCALEIIWGELTFFCGLFGLWQQGV